MRSKILVRILIVLLAAFLIFRIHQRVETYRIPRELCRAQIETLAKANVQHIFEHEGSPAPDLDSLLKYAEEKGYFSTTMNADSITVVFRNDITRRVKIPEAWKNLWNETALGTLRKNLAITRSKYDSVLSVIVNREAELGFPLDSLLVLRDAFIKTAEMENEDLSPGEYFNDSLGFDVTELLNMEESLAAAADSITSLISEFNSSIAPARKDSVARTVAAVCPTLWRGGYFDSTYSYDPKLALGTQFSISCPNIDRHGGVVGGFFEKDYPDSVFMEPDWSETQLVYAFPEYARMRRLQASRANLIRAAEEEAAYLAQRYPVVIIPKDPDNLEVGIDELIDPLGGEYVFELVLDTTYVFYENPRGRTRRARGDSIVVETLKFVGYTTADSDSSKVEVYFSHPMTFPSRAEGAAPGDNDKVTVIYFWEKTELGDVKIDERDVDLLDEPTWEFLSSHFADTASEKGE